MKKIMILLVCVMVVLAFTGCAKVVSTQEKDVSVKIVSTYHRGMWLQPMKVGKVTTHITHPAQYKVRVEYDGQELSIDNSDAYRFCKDKEGQKVNATIKIIEYEDGTTSYRLLSINQ